MIRYSRSCINILDNRTQHSKRPNTDKISSSTSSSCEARLLCFLCLWIFPPSPTIDDPTTISLSAATGSSRYKATSLGTARGSVRSTGFSRSTVHTPTISTTFHLRFCQFCSCSPTRNSRRRRMGVFVSLTRGTSSREYHPCQRDKSQHFTTRSTRTPNPSCNHNVDIILQ
jgi:hypothetical protein